MSLSRSDLVEAAWSLGIGLGDKSLDELRAKALRMSGARKEAKYEDQNEETKKHVDRIVNEMQESSGAFAQIIKATARLTRLQFTALVEEGFTEEQALQIVCSQGPPSSQ